jgi:hypothetical protein
MLSHCGARTGFDFPMGRGEGTVGGSDAGSLAGETVPGIEPACTGSTGIAVGSADRSHVGACRFHSAEFADLSNPGLVFVHGSDLLPLALVNSKADCDTVNGLGWYLVPNVPGFILMAPVVMTFEVCPTACNEIGSGVGWGLVFNINTCK